jgi:hypothetical protein
MNIYSDNANVFFFHTPYAAKRLLNDSISRTHSGYHSMRSGAILKGSGNLLLGRVQSAAAFAFVTLTTAFLAPVSIILMPCFVVPAAVLNAASRIPGISSFKTVQNFTQRSSDVILRTFKVSAIAIPVISTFLFASTVNTFLPGILKAENIFLEAIHRLVKQLGPLQNIRVEVPGAGKVVGCEKRLSALGALEEYLRVLSYKNLLKDVIADRVIVHYAYSR